MKYGKTKFKYGMTKFKNVESKFKKINSKFKKIKCNIKHKLVSGKLHLFRRKFKRIKSSFQKMKSNLAEACPGVEMGGRGAEAYQVTEAGERRTVPCPGNYVRVYRQPALSST